MLNVVALLMIWIFYRNLFLEGFLKGKKLVKLNYEKHYFALFRNEIK